RRVLFRSPSDEKAAAALVSQAVLSTDVDKIAEVLQAVLEINAPAPSLAPFVAQALRALRNLDSERAEELGKRVLRSMGVRSKEVVDALIVLAKECSAPSLLAAITERQLVSATGSDRAGLSLALARQRLSASQTAAAARALRRALAQGADRSLVEEAMQDFDHTVEPDGKLALLEIEAELSRGASRESDLIRADALRHLGAARWDMAQDVQGAVNLWLKAAELDPDKGLEYLAHYLHHIAGAEAAA